MAAKCVRNVYVQSQKINRHAGVGVGEARPSPGQHVILRSETLQERECQEAKRGCHPDRAHTQRAKTLREQRLPGGQARPSPGPLAYPKGKDSSKTATARRPSARTHEHSAPPAPGSCVVQMAGDISTPKSGAGRQRARLSTAEHNILKERRATSQEAHACPHPRTRSSISGGPSGFMMTDPQPGVVRDWKSKDRKLLSKRRCSCDLHFTCQSAICCVFHRPSARVIQRSGM